MDEETIFLEAIRKPTPDERVAFVRRACAGDAALCRGVEQLLRAHERAGRFLEPEPTVADTPVAERPGTAIGPYKLLEEIGEGGFGVVFMAEQQRPVRRKVALKVLKPGMDTRQVVARFEAERQALALMDHPNIARVFDGGETAGGRPYFVMELVNGLPVTEYCDQARLTSRERLGLFAAACRAVQHAHQKGVIHRDIKPSNVLVTLHDGTPVVKVIDFGIAKATGQRLTDKTLFTHFAQLVGTPLYMSPEQAALSGLDVDTRSDIYSLGVLLYELLTGTTPFDKERFRTAGYDEICRIIREEEPPRPSTRVGTPRRAPAAVPSPRAGDPGRLGRLFRDEMDWIVMKCLEKDRNRRYDTAGALVRDVERYLRDEPVLACPPSALYRFRKFARRNKRPLWTAAVLGVALLASVAVAAGSLGWAARDRAARLAATEGRAKDALEEAVQFRDRKRWPEALEAVKRAEGILDGGGGEELRRGVRELKRDVELVLRLEEIRLPGVGTRPDEAQQAERDDAYARAFREHGIDVDGVAAAEAAARVAGRAVTLELSTALDEWARALRARKAPEAAWKHLVAVARAADPDAWRNRLRDAWECGRDDVLKELAGAADLDRQPVESLALLVSDLDVPTGQAVLRLAWRKYPNDFWINFKLAWEADHARAPDLPEAIRFYTAALALRPRNVPTHVFLAKVLTRDGKADEAVALGRMLVDLDPGGARARNQFGVILRENGHPAAAAAEFREAIRLAGADPGAAYHYNLGLALTDAGDPGAAVAAFREGLEIANDRPLLHAGLGRALRAAGEQEAALAELRAAVGLWERQRSTDPRSLYNAACSHALTAAILASGAKGVPAREAADRSVALLQRAVRAGYHDAAGPGRDKDLDALRDREDFKKLLADLQAAEATPRAP